MKLVALRAEENQVQKITWKISHQIEYINKEIEIIKKKDKMLDLKFYCRNQQQVWTEGRIIELKIRQLRLPSFKDRN